MKMQAATGLGAVVFAAAMLVGATGCSATTTASAGPQARLTVQQEKAVIHIEGDGKVEGGSIACGPSGEGTCAGDFGDLWATHLVAKPAPDWRFMGWKRAASDAIAPSFGAEETVTYTARFERDEAAVATAR